MLLVELLGLDAGPVGHGYHRTGKQTGRPHEYKIRPRPKKNLMFKNKKLWHDDMYLNHNGNFDLVSTEDEEVIIACCPNRQEAYGKWNNSKNQGVTYKKPLPLRLVIDPTAVLRDYEHAQR